MTEPRDLSLSEAAAAIRARRLSPVELMQSLLDQIRRLDGDLRAFETVSEHALRDASELEREWEARNARSSLHGVPFAVKDNFDTAGLRTTASSRHWQDRVPARDSAAVARLRHAGMPVIGKTATHEFAHGATTPAVRNPWDLDRLPGGSSGGSAAALSARMAPAALGTDSGGSIRTPAAICGVTGVKPTFGRVSRAGVAPLSWTLDHAGPMARSVGDIALLLELISGYDAADAASADRPASEVRPRGADVTGRRIGIPTNYFSDGFIADDVAQRVESVARELAGAGAHLVSVELPHADLYEATGFTILSAEASAVHAERIRRAPELFTDDVRWSLEAGMGILATDYLAAMRSRSMIQDSWGQLMSEVDLVLAPTVPGTAVPADSPMYGAGATMVPAGFVYVRSALPANLTGLPALSVPVGLDAHGLPIGVQLIGRPFREAALLEVGLAIEALFGPLDAPAYARS